MLKNGSTAVPLQKIDTNFANHVGFSAVPISKDDNFEIFNGGFSIESNQNIGNILATNKGLAAAPLPVMAQIFLLS